MGRRIQLDNEAIAAYGNKGARMSFALLVDGKKGSGLSMTYKKNIQTLEGVIEQYGIERSGPINAVYKSIPQK